MNDSVKIASNPNGEKGAKHFDPLKDIKDFHEKFELVYQGRPRYLPWGTQEFRLAFLMEELCEYGGLTKSQQKALSQLFTDIAGNSPINSLENKLDALVDLMYVLLGTAYLHGFDRFEEAWKRVHEANMSKVRCKREEDSSRGSTFDVVKPEGWEAPDLSDLVDTSSTTG